MKENVIFVLVLSCSYSNPIKGNIGKVMIVKRKYNYLLSYVVYREYYHKCCYSYFVVDILKNTQ